MCGHSDRLERLRDDSMEMIGLARVFVIVALVMPPLVAAETIHVPAEYSKIQDAVDRASSGDTILVGPGVYGGEGNRDISFFGKNLKLIAVDGPLATTLDAGGQPPSDIHRCFFLAHGETAETLIEGFTLRNGYLIGDTGGTGIGGGGGGGAFYIRGSSPTIRNCIVEGHVSAALSPPFPVDGRGAGIYIDGQSSARIENCIFRNNYSDRRGGGVYIGYADSSVAIRNSLFYGNSTSSSYGGGAIYVAMGACEVGHTTIADNFGGNVGGGVANEHGDILLQHVVLHNNVATYGSEIFTRAPGEVAIEYSNVPTYKNAIDGAGSPLIVNWGEGNIDEKPRFSDAGNGDYQLLAGSPCIDSGDPLVRDAKSEVDAIGQPRIQHCRIDIGGLESSFPRDCNSNQVGDVCEVYDGSSEDCNQNLVPDGCEPPSISTSTPPDGAIDARQPFELDGSNPIAWDVVKLIMCGELEDLTIEEFEIASSGAAGPEISEVTQEGQLVTLSFTVPIEPGQCVTIMHPASDTSVTLGFLPGDVSGMGMVDGFDIITLVNHLNGLLDLELWQCDIDRSGTCEPRDILRLIDLLNGANEYEPWALEELPECP